jgi:hypothetical protein
LKQGFLTGVLASIIAGGLLWGGNELYADWKKDRAKVISYQTEDKQTVVTPELLRIVKTLEQGNVISTVEIVNTGREDLVDARIRITDMIDSTGENLLDFGVIDTIGEKIETPKISKANGSILVEYPLLRPSEGTKMWIANKGYSMLELRNSQPALVLEEKDNSTADIASDLWSFIFYVGISVGAFILGIIAAESLNRHVLRRIGLDPDEVTKLYTEAEKNKKNG